MGLCPPPNQDVISLADRGADVYTPDSARQTNLCTHKYSASAEFDFHQETKTRIHHHDIR
jgi:hypothetical protein